ncbi:MAG: ribose 5-phosphate isomerase B [Anaerolineae bacterium]|nr:ribose 5-phosphate isomerase B [Anaerolineae bacterium]
MNDQPTIAIGSDHAGFQYKEAIKAHLLEQGYAVQDLGTHSPESVDYPLYIRPVAEAVAHGDYGLGIVLGGSGNGEAIVANKVKGIRCALCWDEYTARMSREHNNANVLSIGERTIPLEMAFKVVDTWLQAEFQGGRHARRVAQIDAMLS